METKEYEHKFIIVHHIMKSLNLEMCEPIEMVELNGKLVAYFVLN
jgi:hypothetical protein